MIMDYSQNQLLQMLKKQCDSLFLYERQNIEHIKKYIDDALVRVEYWFSHVENKYYYHVGKQGERIVRFNMMHQCQYFIFLYYLANTIFIKEGEDARGTCDILYALAKSLSSADLYLNIMVR